ncbi:MAG: EutN/CcmL family microcompartment protein [Paracoccaceae bacterium]
MRLGRVTGTVHATIKDAQLTGRTLLLLDVVDGKGKLLEPAHVAVDTCGAGVGDQVLIIEGSAARLATGVTGTPVDAAIVAVVDAVSVGK